MNSPPKKDSAVENSRRKCDSNEDTPPIVNGDRQNTEDQISSDEDVDVAFILVMMQPNSTRNVDLLPEPSPPETTRDSTANSSNESLQLVSSLDQSEPETALSTETEPIREELQLLPRRSTRVRKLVDRLRYDYLGQTKLQRIADEDIVKQLYHSKLLAGKQLWARWKSPEMAATRKAASRRLFLQEHS